MKFQTAFKKVEGFHIKRALGFERLNEGAPKTLVRRLGGDSTLVPLDLGSHGVFLGTDDSTDSPQGCVMMEITVRRTQKTNFRLPERKGAGRDTLGVWD